MNDFNSRYRNLDNQPDTIRTNTGGYGYNGFPGGRYDNGGFGNDMDIMQAENAQKKKQVARASQARGGSSARGRKAKRQMLIYGGIILVEVILLAVIWIMYFTYSGDSDSSSKADTENSESAEAGGQSGNINVDNDDFSLICNKLSITNDINGIPAAVVYFEFTNKTDQPLSMSQVFVPSFKQNGTDLPVGAALPDQPAEVANASTPVSGGQSITCAYAVSLQDTASEVTITMHDNYETFSDIGSTVVPLQ